MKSLERGASDFSIIAMLILGAFAISLVTYFNSCIKEYKLKHRQGYVEVPYDYEGEYYEEEKPKTLYDYGY